MIQNYADFLETLLSAGFSMGGGGSTDGVYSVIPCNWNEEAPYPTAVQWHTEDPETDPWEWRMRVLAERDDIAYAKLFFKKSGYITRDWYPCFLAARRGGRTFYDAYEGGTLSHAAKRIYEVVLAHGRMASHEIKQAAGFGREDKAVFDRALTELQMGLFVTVCGSQRTANWASAVFCTTEHFWGQGVFAQAHALAAEAAAQKITAQMQALCPTARPKKIRKFIFG